MLVGMPGFEPGASTSRTWRAAKLRYIPSSAGSVLRRRAGGQPDLWRRPGTQASVDAPSGSGTTNRYPIPGSVSSTWGAEGSSSFLRRLAT